MANVSCQWPVVEDAVCWLLFVSCQLLGMLFAGSQGAASHLFRSSRLPSVSTRSLVRLRMNRDPGVRMSDYVAGWAFTVYAVLLAVVFLLVVRDTRSYRTEQILDLMGGTIASLAVLTLVLFCGMLAYVSFFVDID